MPIGSRRSRSGDDYVFVDGRAVRASEMESANSVPGQQEAASSVARRPHSARRSRADGAPMQAPAGKRAPAAATAGAPAATSDALDMRQSDELRRDDRRSMRRKCLAFGGVLLVLTLFSLCISDGYYGKLYSPVEVVSCYGAWFRVTGAQLFDPVNAERVYFDVMAQLPMYNDVIYTFLSVFKYLGCGVLLAVSGMLYQNTFRNPIAAPSMLGVTNGINIAVLVLVLQFGYNATQNMGLYYLYSFIGGALVLALVMLGGKYMSGKGNFNVVNMLLIGTIVSQLLGVIVTYAQNFLLDEASWDAFYRLQYATGIDSNYTYLTILIGLIVAFAPVIALRFRLNLVAFDDAEMRMLGVNADGLRMLALACGSIMILTAQVNAGQVAMISLVIPFVVRAVFGAEFRKQLIGNVLCGALVMLVAGDIVSFVVIHEVNLNLGSVVTICSMPLFVWMVAANQRTWE